jgi:hypothetical protein
VTLFASILEFLRAATAAMKALPMLLAWKVNSEVEAITQQIIKHEALNTPTDSRIADELRIALLYRRRLHDVILANQNPTGSRNPGPNA